MALGIVAPVRDFPLGTVLTVTTGRLLAPLDGLYDILEYMSDGPVWTHQLPTVGRLMEEPLYEQHPWLRGVEVPEGLDTEEKVNAFVAEIAAVRGDTLPITPAPDLYTHPNSVVDLAVEFEQIRKRVNRGASE